MTNVLIVATTHMSGDRVCVGAFDLVSGRNLRLLDAVGEQPTRGNYSVGQVWQIQYKKVDCILPHSEDVLVQSKSLISNNSADTYEIIASRVNPWEGSPDVLFSGLLKWTANGSGFYRHNADSPLKISTGYWRPDADLFFD